MKKILLTAALSISTIIPFGKAQASLDADVRDEVNPRVLSREEDFRRKLGGRPRDHDIAVYSDFLRTAHLQQPAIPTGIDVAAFSRRIMWYVLWQLERGTAEEEYILGTSNLILSSKFLFAFPQQGDRIKVLNHFLRHLKPLSTNEDPHIQSIARQRSSLIFIENFDLLLAHRNRQEYTENRRERWLGSLYRSLSRLQKSSRSLTVHLSMARLILEFRYNPTDIELLGFDSARDLGIYWLNFRHSKQVYKFKLIIVY